MHATNQDDIAIAEQDAPRTVLSHADARGEDAHWAREHSSQRYFRAGLEYEDYAPAYCVGYIGFAQYGGRFEDAERSLCANWERIKGDSRLGLDDALLAMRAAWDRMAGLGQPRVRSEVPRTGTRRPAIGVPSFRLG